MIFLHEVEKKIKNEKQKIRHCINNTWFYGGITLLQTVVCILYICYSSTEFPVNCLFFLQSFSHHDKRHLNSKAQCSLCFMFGKHNFKCTVGSLI